jgi:hypothetical protein
MEAMPMTGKDHKASQQQPTADAGVDQNRRATLSRLGRFAAVTPPAVALILAARTKPALAATSVVFSSRQFKERVSVPQLRKAA